MILHWGKTFEIGEVFLQTKFFFNSASQYCLTVAWIQLQMLFRCYVLHINTTIIRHILHLVYLCPVLGLILFILNLGFISIFSLIFIIITDTLCFFVHLFLRISQNSFRSGSRTAATSKMELFMIIVNGFQPLTIITKRSVLDVAAVLDPPLSFGHRNTCVSIDNALDNNMRKEVNKFQIPKVQPQDVTWLLLHLPISA